MLRGLHAEAQERTAATDGLDPDTPQPRRQRRGGDPFAQVPPDFAR